MHETFFLLSRFIKKHQLYLTFITQLERLSFPRFSEKEINKIKSFIDEFIIIEMSSKIKTKPKQAQILTE